LGKKIYFLPKKGIIKLCKKSYFSDPFAPRLPDELKDAQFLCVFKINTNLLFSIALQDLPQWFIKLETSQALSLA
jgi:hypothetical protein